MSIIKQLFYKSCLNINVGLERQMNTFLGLKWSDIHEYQQTSTPQWSIMRHVSKNYCTIFQLFDKNTLILWARWLISSHRGTCLALTTHQSGECRMKFIFHRWWQLPTYLSCFPPQVTSFSQNASIYLNCLPLVPRRSMISRLSDMLSSTSPDLSSACAQFDRRLYFLTFYWQGRLYRIFFLRLYKI